MIAAMERLAKAARSMYAALAAIAEEEPEALPVRKRCIVNFEKAVIAAECILAEVQARQENCKHGWFVPRLGQGDLYQGQKFCRDCGKDLLSNEGIPMSDEDRKGVQDMTAHNKAAKNPTMPKGKVGGMPSNER